jgi:hypothetical protein
MQHFNREARGFEDPSTRSTFSQNISSKLGADGKLISTAETQPSTFRTAQRHGFKQGSLTNTMNNHNHMLTSDRQLSTTTATTCVLPRHAQEPNQK